MRRSLVSRATALLIAGLVGLSGAGVSLAHGWAHNEAQEHAERNGEHHHRPISVATPTPVDEVTSSVQRHGSQGHSHPQLALAVSVRTDAPLFVLPKLPASLPGEIVFAGIASRLLTAAPARASPPDDLPRQPRAPPLG